MVQHRKSTIRPLAALLGLSWLVFAAAVVQGASSFTVDGYSVHLWQAEDGLPANNVTAVVQTRDGYLWLGTRNGLVRFDGVRFTVFDSRNTPEIRAPHVSSLYEDGSGVLWIGFLTGEVLSYRDGSFRRELIHASWSGGKIFAFASDAANGDLWVINQAGELARLRDEAVIPEPAERVTHLLSLSREANGRVWLQRENDVVTLEGGQLRAREFTITETNRYIQGVAPRADGRGHSRVGTGAVGGCL